MAPYLSTQVRRIQPDATECTEADALELMEMILGALGRDAIGLGSRWGGGGGGFRWASGGAMLHKCRWVAQ